MTLAFFDSNILIYALGEDRKAELARDFLDRGGRISIQTLNEFANVTRKKLKLDWGNIEHLLATLRQRLAPVLPLTEVIHVDGLRLARQYGFSFYDALIVAAALAAGCDSLYSEDMHRGLVVDNQLTIINPFA